MKKEEILSNVQKKKALIGEMEKTKINKACWVALIVAGILAVAFMIIEGALGHYPAIWAIGAICHTWASAFFFGQYFMAKRPWPVLMGAILSALGAGAMITCYILFNIGVM